MTKSTKEKAHHKERRNFSSFTLKEAMQLLGIEVMLPWALLGVLDTIFALYHQNRQQRR